MTTDAAIDSARLNEAADYLDYLYQGSKHIPADLVHDRDFRVGFVRGDNDPIAQFFYGGAAEVFLALGPASLPLLSHLLRQQAMEKHGHIGHSSQEGHHCCSTSAALALTDHILKAKEAEA